MTHLSSNSATLLIVEPDDDTRPLLKENLEHQGYRVLIALDEMEAIAHGTHYSSVDLILINQFKLSIDESLALGRRIRREAALSEKTPIVVLAERYGPEIEGQNVQRDAYSYVAYLEDAQQLLDFLSHLLGAT